MTGSFAWPSDQNASGRSLGAEEISLVTEALKSGTLTSTKGRFVRELERAFAETMGVSDAIACASGTGAIHAALASIDPEPGDEIVTSPITDMGAITPILYQGAIPVFADVDPRSCNVTADTVRARLSARTRAIIVTHLFGNPCDMAPISALAASRGIKIIEDCSQAFLASDGGRLVGTHGTVAVFSLQQGKHITCGEGGLVITNEHAIAKRVRNFVNKAWDYGSPTPDHDFLALNYRMTELQGAVSVAQLRGLPAFVDARRERAKQLSETLTDIPELVLPTERTGGRHSYWRYPLHLDGDGRADRAITLGRLLANRGISAAPRYIKKPAFDCAIFRNQRTFGSSRWPFTLARKEALDYSRDRFTGVYAALDRIVVLPWNERVTEIQVQLLSEAIHGAMEQMRRQG